MSDNGPRGSHMRATEFWEEVIGDMETTAAEYEDSGWETHTVHPGDVTPLSSGDDDEEFGLDVLVPDDEFEEIETLIDGGVAFDSYEVYRATGNGLVFVVVAMEDDDAGVALLYPAYYDVQEGESMLVDAKREGKLYTFLRTLTEDRITLTHDDPALFAPPEGE